MSKTRNNHYVPQWYQEGFFEVGRNTLAYLDLTPERRVLVDGREYTEKSLFFSPTSRMFRQQDLYSTFFGTSVNDEIERYLFGDIDTRGANAVRAFAGTDVREWHRHFMALFEYIDIQKFRTPKGLDWLKTLYPALSQNELMQEMQGIRMMHCTIWTEGVREIISAEDSDIKFIVSDHPVTIYNYAIPPNTKACCYPNDPSIALKASQTIFPLSSNFCLLLTNLEYAKDPSTGPFEKRTFARNYRNSMVKTDSFIRQRKLTRLEVASINCITKARARRYVAAGRKEWLYPEKVVPNSWEEHKAALLPPRNELWHFGGEIIVQYDSGHVRFQDEFGRTEKERDFLKKEKPPASLRPGYACGCGSGRTYKACCHERPVALRPSWDELSIRERNMSLMNGILDILDLNSGKNWLAVRRDLTDEQIRKIYLLYEALWPLETDLLALLPKPDGRSRAIYTGQIHPEAIADFALGSSLYFGELIVQHPFLHNGTVNKKFKPVENPGSYRQEFIKSVLFFLTVMPLVEDGIVNLIPDPCDFDIHLREQMYSMAQSRSSAMKLDPSQEPRLKKLMRQDAERGIWSMSDDTIRSQIKATTPELDETAIEVLLRFIERRNESDPLAVLTTKTTVNDDKNGQFSFAKLAPNFEMAMYLAQATGSCIVTDSVIRWEEIQKAIYRKVGKPQIALSSMKQKIENSTFAFLQDVNDISNFGSKKTLAAYPSLIQDLFRYLSKLDEHGTKPNREANLVARFNREHSIAQMTLKKSGAQISKGLISCVFPEGGIQDNTVNRLLLMSSSEHHLPNVPMAFFIEGQINYKAKV